MNNLIKVKFDGIVQLVFNNHINLFNNCGSYPAAKHLNKLGYSIDYALACLSVSKYKTININQRGIKRGIK